MLEVLWHRQETRREAVKEISLQIFYPYGQGEMPIALSPREQGSHGICHRAEGQISDPEFPKSLRAMIENDWVCYDDILINGDPNGKITRGCYVKS